MKKIWKESRFYIGLICIIQTVPFVILFFTQWKRRKSLAAACLAVALVSAAFGAALVTQSARTAKERLLILDALCNEYLLSEEEIVCRDEED